MNTISEFTRRAIMDYLSLQVSWSGRLEEADFLARIYDLNNMPSYDHRFENAHGDIWQHRTNNNDWPDEWVFTDKRFNLLWGPDDDFLRFLCETVHPVVRSDEEKALIMASTFNIHLRKDGWAIKTHPQNKQLKCVVLDDNDQPINTIELRKALEAEIAAEKKTKTILRKKKD